MSSSSRSSKGNHYRQGNNGSNHYQKKGISENYLTDLVGEVVQEVDLIVTIISMKINITIHLCIINL